MPESIIVLPQRLLIALVRGYRLLLSPWLGSQCRFEPTCSVYALQALERHGAWRGSGLALARLARCHPFCAGGHDPVPPPGHRRFTSLIATPGEPLPPSSPVPDRTAP